MASLQKLLAEEGFEHLKFLKSRSSSSRRHDKVGMASMRRGSSDSKSVVAGDDQHQPAMDDAAIKAVVSILGGYIGRCLKDVGFRERIKEKCSSCLVRRTKDSDNGVFTNIELGIESIERLIVSDQGTTKKELRMKLLRNSIQLLSNVASLNSAESRNRTTCGVPNSHLSACAQLYLSIVYKLEKNDRISARHLLRVFCDSPFLARTHLLPDLWEHFLLPHLLHLKVWYHEELENLSRSHQVDKEKRMKGLSKVYNDEMDMGTILFALYYKEWLKIGGKAPAPPSVPLPSRPRQPRTRRRSSESYTSSSSVNRNLYRTVFGPEYERRSIDLDSHCKASTGTSVLEDGSVCTEEDGRSHQKYATRVSSRSDRRRHSINDLKSSSSELWPVSNAPAFKLFTCQTALSECLVNSNTIVKNNSTKKEEKIDPPCDDLSRAIATICNSDSLSDCEVAVRLITKTWLVSHGNTVIEGALLKAVVIEGMLEVLFASEDDEILELVISVLAEFAERNESTRMIVLNSDPHLEIFTRLLKRTSLFLKSVVLLYLLKPKAKQMISLDWVTLTLRVLEFGDQLQILFTVRCVPRKAAMYLLNQLLTGFSEDRNLENASQVVSLGGLCLLVKSFEIDDVNERKDVAKLMSCCIRADATCKGYLADNLSKTALLELIVDGMQHKSKGFALDLLFELLCLDRRTQTIKFLSELKVGWNGLSTMHILLVYLQRSSPKESPLAAAILLQLDLLGDPLKFSVFREEAIEAIIRALDCQTCNPKIQEQSARAMMMLGRCFSSFAAEDWLLQQAVFPDRSQAQFLSKELVHQNLNQEEEAHEDWQRRVALVLLNSGGKRFLTSLSNSIANGIPSLAQASLFTVSWMNRVLLSVEDKNSQSMANIQDAIKSPECVCMLSTLDKELIEPLRDPY